MDSHRIFMFFSCIGRILIKILEGRYSNIFSGFENI